MRYATRNEAIRAEVVEAIEASGTVRDARAEYDVDAIAEAVLGDHAQGYACTVDPEAFWAIVAEHAAT